MRTNSVWKEFFHHTLPSTAGMFGLSCYILADTFFIAQALGANGLTALNLAIPVYSFIHGTGLMLGMGGATRCSILRHQREETRAQQVYTHTLLLGVVFALCFFLCGLFGADAITRMLGADEAVFDLTRTYLRVLLLFAPLFLLNEIMLPFVRNDGAPKLAMLGLLGSSLSNIVLDYLFIFPLDLGIFGAVLATSIAPTVSLLLLSPFLLSGKRSFHLVRCPFRPRVCGMILTLGLPSLVAEVSAGVVMIVFNGIILSLCGNLGVAAYGVVSNIALVVTAVYTGIAQGIQPPLSQSFGSGDQARIQGLLRCALTSALAVSMMLYALIFLAASPIAAVFNSQGDPLLQQMAAEGLRWYFTSCFFIGINVVLAVYFSSTDRSRPANAISLLRGLFLPVPMAFLLAALGGMDGLWLAVTVTELLVSILGSVFYRKA